VLLSNTGGILVPAQLDPTINLTSTGSGTEAEAMRGVASVRQATSNVYRAVTSAGVTATFAAENAEVADNAPVLASIDIAIHKAHAYIPASVEIVQDGGPGFADEMTTLLREARARLESDKFVNGTGTGEPWGMAARLVQAAKTVATTGADAIVLADVYAVKAAVPARWRANGSWVVSDLALDSVRRLGETVTGNAAHLVEGLADGVPDRLLGRPLVTNTYLDKPGATAAAGNDDTAIFGDLKQYVIADRFAGQIEFVPMTFGPNGRPTGGRGWYYWWRVGADFVVPDAARVLRA
jgi:HK97 family phage major capsid protein